MNLVHSSIKEQDTVSMLSTHAKVQSLFSILVTMRIIQSWNPANMTKGSFFVQSHYRYIHATLYIIKSFVLKLVYYASHHRASESNIFAAFLSFWFKGAFQAWIQTSDIIAITSITKPICDVWPQMVESIGSFCPFAV